MVLLSRLAALPFGTHRLYQSELACIGATRCPPHADWRVDLEPIRQHVFVFPLAPVWVERAREEPFLADANRVLFHAEGDEIRRRSVDGRGALGVWIAIRYDHLLAALERTERDRHGACPGPFHLRHGPCSGAAFRRQALLVRELLAGRCDSLRADEIALELMAEVLSSAYVPWGGARGVRGPTRRRQAHLVEEVRAWFGLHFRSAASLADIAAAVGSSPFHLARVFRAHTGLTLNAYRMQLRLRAATEAILEGEEDLSGLALELGFASHSHMTDAFRAATGLPPSALRRGAC